MFSKTNAKKSPWVTFYYNGVFPPVSSDCGINVWNADTIITVIPCPVQMGFQLIKHACANNVGLDWFSSSYSRSKVVRLFLVHVKAGLENS